LRAVLIAHSIASAPEFVKKATSAKVWAVSRSASFSWLGIRKTLDVCQSFSAWSLTACTSLGWLWPSAVTAMPAMQSR
jgi:hypothetical protein